MSSPVQLQARQLLAQAGARRLLDDACIHMAAGDLLGIVGPNGAGKTSLLRALLGWLPLRGGQVLLQGRPLADWSLSERARRMAYLSQGQTVHWPMPVRDVVALGRLPYGDAKQRSGQQAIEAALHATSMQDLAERNVQSLSGGERARALLARALAVQAPVLLADEPLAALDPAQQLHCMALLREQARQGQAVAVVLHDLSLASRFCSHLLLLDGGRSLRYGPPAQVLDDDALAQTFGIEALHIANTEQAHCILPWRPLSSLGGSG
ncbi:ABC transporter ATP-binding protein [Comamonadaceae bacterium OH3737_COT-264]|nr:ABC transporter ATP-binding protein [Comamonadaceae bacterium OH3737_COT-264]